MYCDKCGTKLPDDAQLCSRCGRSFVEPEPAQIPEPVAPAPIQIPEPVVQQPVPAQPVKPKKPLSKMKYMYTSGGAVSWTAFLVLLLAVVLVGCGLYNTLYGSIFEIPTVQLVDVMTDGRVETLERYFDAGEVITTEAENLLAELKVEYAHGTPQQQRILDTAQEFVESVQQFYDERSIMAISTVLSQISENEDWIGLWEETQQRGAAIRSQGGALSSAGGYGGNSMQSEAAEYTEVLDLVIPVIICCYAFCMLLTLLAAIFRNTVLTVFGMICSVFICLLLSSVVLSLIILALHITGIVLNTIAGNKYARARKLYIAA